MIIKEAKHFIKLFLVSNGYAGITLPPFGIYILKERINETALINHEMVHWEQYKKLGAIGFYIKYLYYSLKYGYWNNPMEVEAREKS